MVWDYGSALKSVGPSTCEALGWKPSNKHTLTCMHICPGQLNLMRPLPSRQLSTYLMMKLQASSGLSKALQRAVGIPWRSINSLANFLLASNWAALAVGPKHFTPTAVRSPTIPSNRDRQSWVSQGLCERWSFRNWDIYGNWRLD